VINISLLLQVLPPTSVSFTLFCSPQGPLNADPHFTQLVICLSNHLAVLKPKDFLYIAPDFNFKGVGIFHNEPISICCNPKNREEFGKYQASAAKWMRAVLFSVVTQHVYW
jgi:hypothetical protein